MSRAASALAAAAPADAMRDPAAAAAYAEAVARAGYRVTLILLDGRVLADSEADPRSMENHGSRPEVAAALAGRPAVARRRSATIGVQLVYAAAPVLSGGKVAGALRLALHLPGLDAALAPVRWELALGSLAFAIAALAAAAAFARMTTRPLASLASVARGYAAGGKGPGAPGRDSATLALGPRESEEMLVLAASLDAMAAEIGARVAAAEAQGRELEAILDAMAEAVLALDGKLRIAKANPAATALFARGRASGGASGGASGERPVEGRGLLEATRSTGLAEIAEACLATGERSSSEVSLFLPQERVFRIFASPMAGSAGEGVVLLLGDVTDLRRLERVRRDFVANVSHELRTPIQLVKGFAETLREESLRGERPAAGPGAGAEAPGGGGESAAEGFERRLRFLGIIERNAARMESLVSDLLSLASLEREGRGALEARPSPIAPILSAAREDILPKAEARGTAIVLDCEPGLSASVDPRLLEQALVNLVDNAVKYSPPGREVRVTARSEGGFLSIEVKDRGFGIPAKDLGRIFERFYRVDKARSRELGGTGLGLAIVRHIALAHGGEASVESWEGEGSTFRVRIPLESRAAE
jgi:two-component system, OmpR family, phosphate regulon sensor histidine kinase PhoR